MLGDYSTLAPLRLKSQELVSGSMKINSSTPQREVLFCPGRAGSVGCGRSERGRIPIQEPSPGASPVGYGHNLPILQI